MNILYIAAGTALLGFVICRLTADMWDNPLDRVVGLNPLVYEQHSKFMSKMQMKNAAIYGLCGGLSAVIVNNYMNGTGGKKKTNKYQLGVNVLGDASTKKTE